MSISSQITDPLKIAQDWYAQGRKLAFITVLSVWGSAPRPAGSHMICDECGNFSGSVSGGCIEAEVIAQVPEILASGKARIVSFGIQDELAWSAGLSCGGTIRLLIAPYSDAVHEALEMVSTAQANRQSITTQTDLQNGKITIIAAPESAKITQLSESVFIQTYRPKPYLLVIGAVHITQALAQMAQITGYDLTILDPRTGFATQERFPTSQLCTEWTEDFFNTHQPDKFTAIIALSHIPHLDDPALIAGLNNDCFYVGALGSRKTHAKRLERLAAAGLTIEACAKIHAPIGLAIQAQEPAEIATAILAEIIQAYRAV